MIGISTQEHFGLPIDEQLRFFHRAGVDAFFTRWTNAEDAARWQKVAREEGLIYQSIHGPDGNILPLWSRGAETEAAIAQLMHCLETCARLEIPILVTHVVQTFDFVSPIDAGVENFGCLVRRASQLGVTLALENLQCEEYTETLLEHLPEAGFCWDSGHEHAYHPGNALLPKWGHRLTCTHLNDNLGVGGAQIHWKDDLHMIPGDGNVDWKRVMGQLHDCGYDGILMFELKKSMYPEMPFGDYVHRACDHIGRIV